MVSTGEDVVIKNMRTKKQKILSHLTGQTIRQIFTNGDNEFVTVSAKDLDKYIVFAHSSGEKERRLKIQNRYEEGAVLF